MDNVERRKKNPVASLKETGLYHSFELNDGRVLHGAMSLEYQKQRLEGFELPERLEGKRVLDIGPWDGFYSFEMERRGADVVAIDYVDLDTFRAIHRTLQSHVDYRRMEVYELSQATVGLFDYVLCLGVLYHLKYPIEGLEKICAITLDTCIVDTFVSDGDEWLSGNAQPISHTEFYEYGELAGQLDNWWGPSVSTVSAWLRTAGFAEIEVTRVTGTTATFKAHRQWRHLLPSTGAALKLIGVGHHLNGGRTFSSGKEEYIEVWADWAGECPSLEQVYPEVSGFAVPALAVSVADGRLQAALRVPYGLASGEHKLRMKVGNSNWSEPWTIHVDLPPHPCELVFTGIQDGIEWRHGVISWNSGGWASAWINNLSPEADPGNVLVYVDDIPHTPAAVHPESGQVNFRLRPIIRAGRYEVYATHRGSSSERCSLEVVGDPPAIKGLESL